MLKLCGKHVRTLGIVSGKSTEQLSTKSHQSRSILISERVKVPSVHNFTDNRPQHMSTIIIRYLPLGEHYFYPLSTAPTITFTKGSLKKGNI